MAEVEISERLERIEMLLERSVTSTQKELMTIEEASIYFDLSKEMKQRLLL